MFHMQNIAAMDVLAVIPIDNQIIMPIIAYDFMQNVENYLKTITISF